MRFRDKVKWKRVTRILRKTRADHLNVYISSVMRINDDHTHGCIERSTPIQMQSTVRQTISVFCQSDSFDHVYVSA